MAEDKNNLRDSLADAVVAVNKKNDANTDKIVGKMGELDAKKEKRMNDKQEGKKAHSKAFLDKLGDVEKAIKNQEVAESVTIKNPEAITGDLKKGLQGVIEALQKELKNFDKNIVVKNDFSNFANLFKSSQDKKSVIDALKKIEDKILPNIEIVDYTLILSDIAKAVEDKEGVNILKDILAKEYNVVFPAIMDVNLDPSLIEDKRIRTVLPDSQVERMSKLLNGDSNSRPIVENANSGNAKTQIADEAGNIIGSSQDANGDYHLDTALIQKIITSANNFTETNLASGATFIGTADETFGVNGIQIFHTADRDCTVYIDQSVDSTFADSTQTYTNSAICLANEPCARIVTSVSPYYRLRITNNGATATTKIAAYTGMTPVISVLPPELSPSGNLQVVSSLRGNENYDRHVWVNPTNELAISPVYRMVGTNFDGTTKDPNFWTELVANGGSVTQGGGEIEVKTSTATGGWAKYTSVRRSRFVAGSAQYFSGGFNFKTVGTAGNIRRVGAYTTTDVVDTPTDGFYFELNGTTFSVNAVADTSDVTTVASGSFNGNKGVNFTPTADTYYSLTIEFTPLGAFFYVNGELLHKIRGAHLSHYMTLPITIENIKTSGATDINFETVGMYIARQGELVTNPTEIAVSGTSTTVCKYGAGKLKGAILGDVTANSVITIYDNTAASGKIIFASGSMEKKVNPFHVDFFDLPFSIGLTLDIATQDSNVTLVYE